MAQGDEAPVEIEWNGHDVPSGLAHLPPGRYRLEPAAGWDFTPEEVAGIEEAAAELDRGEGEAAEVVFKRLRDRIASKAGH